jgi:hypothetical protein
MKSNLSILTTEDIINSFEYKRIVRDIKKYKPWVLDIYLNPERGTNHTFGISLDTVIDPYLLQKEIGNMIKYTIIISSLKGYDTSARVLYDVFEDMTLDEGFAIDKIIENRMEQIGSFLPKDVSLTKQHNRKFFIGTHTIPNNNILPVPPLDTIDVEYIGKGVDATDIVHRLWNQANS